ncbi:MAG: hypothetical protein M0R51_09005 [Clostridia bacterium]|nr:hypothetical protein [Clostridia bacterium]
MNKLIQKSKLIMILAMVLFGLVLSSCNEVRYTPEEIVLKITSGKIEVESITNNSALGNTSFNDQWHWKVSPVDSYSVDNKDVYLLISIGIVEYNDYLNTTSTLAWKLAFNYQLSKLEYNSTKYKISDIAFGHIIDVKK